MKYTFCLFIIICLSCAKKPYSSTNKIYKKQAKEFAELIKKYPLEDSFTRAAFVGTTNFNLRKPNFVIIHHTAQNSCEQTLYTFTTQRTQVSAHYVICKDGTIHHMLNDYLRAWHAGVSRWGNDADINSSSIGIELDNNGFEDFTGAQMHSLLQLLSALKKQYNIPVANFIGHGDIALGLLHEHVGVSRQRERRAQTQISRWIRFRATAGELGRWCPGQVDSRLQSGPDGLRQLPCCGTCRCPDRISWWSEMA